MPQTATRTHIANVAIRVCRVPREERRVSTAHANTRHGHILVDVTPKSGLTGTGWTLTMGSAGIAAEALARSCPAPTLPERDAHDREAIRSPLWKRSHQPGAGGVAAPAVSAARPPAAEPAAIDG